jgi:hypothetical protein
VHPIDSDVCVQTNPPPRVFQLTVTPLCSFAVAWTQLTGSAEWTGRTGHMCVHFLNRYFIFGGLTPQPSNDVFTSLNGSVWEAAAPASWTPRAFSGIEIFNGLLWIAGGTDLVNSFEDVWSSGDGSSWHPAVLSPGWPARDSACFLAFHNVLWIFGGRAADGSALKDVWRSDVTGEEWGQVESSAVWQPRFSAGCNPLPGQEQIMMVGGASSGYFNDGWLSTQNLLCEDSGIVCSLHGTCTPMTQSPLLVSQPTTTINTPTIGSVPPFPINCTCDEGWMNLRCSERVCNPSNCINGVCTLVNSSSGQEEDCICTDPSRWVGESCNTAVCMAGCSPIYGKCTNAPGTCTCIAGWTGQYCTVELTWLRTVGKFVDDNVEACFVSVTAAGISIILLSAVLANVKHAQMFRESTLNDAAKLPLLDEHRLLVDTGRSRHGSAVSFAPSSRKGNVASYGTAIKSNKAPATFVSAGPMEMSTSPQPDLDAFNAFTLGRQARLSGGKKVRFTQDDE